MQIPEPEFEGQTKTRLGNPEVRKITEGIVSQVPRCCHQPKPPLSTCSPHPICLQQIFQHTQSTCCIPCVPPGFLHCTCRSACPLRADQPCGLSTTMCGAACGDARGLHQGTTALANPGGSVAMPWNSHRPFWGDPDKSARPSSIKYCARM